MFTASISAPIAASGLLLAVFATPVLAEVVIKKEDANWQVQAKDEPVTGVLAAIGKRADIKISGTRKLISDPEISGAWDGPIDVVLSRILRGVDYVTETGPAADGSLRITRLIVLSGEVGQEPTARAVRAARKLQNPPTTAEIQQAKQDGARVTSLLNTQARMVAGAPGESSPDEQRANAMAAAGGGSGITRNEDGTFDIDPETQARLAEATRRAQADLLALTNALRQNENNGSD